eukprot:6187396-Pleurochrysis_carterae.AAC.1
MRFGVNLPLMCAKVRRTHRAIWATAVLAFQRARLNPDAYNVTIRCAGPNDMAPDRPPCHDVHAAHPPQLS